MSKKSLMLWFSFASVVGILWGVVFAFYGLGILPIVTPEALIPWGNGVYGATLIGLCATFFFAGRHAFRKNDTELMKALLYGLGTWLVIEGAFSLYYGVYINAAVDLGVLIVLGLPLLIGIRSTHA